MNIEKIIKFLKRKRAKTTSKYTTELRYICEYKAGLSNSTGYHDISDIIEKARIKIFNFNYPIFDNNYKKILETKILKHFYTREICCETVGLWLLYLDRKMNEIMPYYNQLYKSELIEFDVFNDVNVTTDHNITGSTNKEESNNSSKNEIGKRENTEKNTSNTVGDVSNTSENISLVSDTPQGGLTGIDNYSYLTNVTKNNVKDNGTSIVDTTNNSSDNENYSNTKNETSALKGSGNSTEEYVEHIIGKRGGKSNSELIMEFRNTFMNIDMLVIEELNDLFFNLW